MANLDIESKIDSLAKIMAEKIDTKQEELNFFKDKLVTLDNERELPLEVIKKIDSDVLSEIEKVNQKLLNLQAAYKARIDSECKSDLFWRVVGITQETLTSPSGGGSVAYDTSTSYTLKCVRLSRNPYPLISLTPPGYTSQQINDRNTLGRLLPPVRSSTKVYYISSTGEATFDYNSLFGITSDNFYGLKYYEEPYSKDIADTFVKSFQGTISAGSTIVTILEPQSSAPTLGINTGQNLVCSKSSVFSTGFNEIVAIGTTVANIDTSVEIRQATATSNLSSFQVSSINISDGGAGYSTTSEAPTITIGAPNGQTAIGTAIISSSGTISLIDVVNGGSAYKTAPTVTISGPTVFAAVGIATTDSLGYVVGFTTLNPGFGYTVAPTITFSDPPVIGVGIGTTAKATASVSGGIVTSVTITNPGFGYTLGPPTVTFSSPGVTTATASAVITGGSVSNIIISNPGAGYTTNPLYPPTITFSEPLKVQATGVSTVSTAGTVYSISITNDGEGYASAPSVTVESPLDENADRLYTLILKNPASNPVSQPESDGTYPTFTVLIDGEELSKILEDSGVAFGENCFSPQTIGIMTTGTLGIGVSVKYDNSGNQSEKRTWRPELASPAITIGNRVIPEVKEPVVGAGKIYNTVGLDFYPIKTPGNPNSKAQEGDTITVVVSQTQSNYYWLNPQGYGTYPLSSYVQPCVSCASTIATNLTTALNELTAAKNAIASGLASLNQKIAAANAFREDLMEVNLQIWSARVLIRQLNEDIDKYRVQLSYAQDPSIRD